MAKRRRKRSPKGRGFSRLIAAISSAFRLFLKVLPWLVLVILLVLLFIGVRKALYDDQNLMVRRIEVTPPDALTLNMKQKLESKLLGKNILKIDLKRVATELEQSAEIRQASVIRQFPSIVKIEVDKRRPAAFIQLSPRGAFGVISEDAMVLDVMDAKNDSLVLVQAFEVGQQNPKVGAMLKIPGFEQAMAFMKAYWLQPIARQETVTKMSLDHLGNMTITLGSGPDVRLGHYPMDRIHALPKIVPILDRQKRDEIEYLDLQLEDVIVKKKKK